MATPSSFYRNAIDLNRYSNSVARQIVVVYNDIIIDAINQLRTIDELAAPVKAARLRAILAQLKESLDTWSGASVQTLAGELQGLALLQSEFVTNELKNLLPRGSQSIVNTVEISPQFAQSVVSIDPTQINLVALSDDLTAAVTGAPRTFSLTAAKGATITLPNGEVIQKAFRGIAVDQAERFNQVIRQGLLAGEPTPAIAKRLIGNLQFGERAKTLRQLEQAGGQATAMANKQILTLVRTSVNQVANAASMQVYEANQDITKKYEYVATLDTRTSAICRSLDGKIFAFGKGPTPPQHFNCRSTIRFIPDKEGLARYGLRTPEEVLGEDRRAARGADGRSTTVPAGTNYGEWLAKKLPNETDSQLFKRQSEALGPSKVPYFRLLSKKYGPQEALAKFVSTDGSELTLKQLQQRYGST